MINTTTQPNNLQVDEETWWLIFDVEKNIILGPMQCSGLISSPHIVVVTDTSEELKQYIIDNDLICKNETRIIYAVNEL